MGNRSSVSRGRQALKKRGTLRIGVITDTHGLYDPVIERHFADVEEIFHAGDIGGDHVIRRLKRLAPVTAVSGNVDNYEASGFPRRLLLRRGGLRIALCHVLYDRGKMTAEAVAWLERNQPDICIFGHSHCPALDRYGRTMLFNPGSAGPRRFSLPRGIGILVLQAGKPTVKLIRLGDRVWAPAPSATTVRSKGASS
ncbi:MAG TPA: metallophosphoesterase family protein [Nitrospira sp.]|nr:metallophosphoesterase family protein [Nitrospira sp.]